MTYGGWYFIVSWYHILYISILGVLLCVGEMADAIISTGEEKIE